jgi:hypothetical protein
MARLGRRTEDLSSLLVCVCNHQGPHPGEVVVLTGKTTGTPPRTGLLPSSAAFSLNHRFSVLPPLLFQLVTVAPNSSTSTLSPEGNLAMTLELGPVPTMSTSGLGAPEEDASIADGRFARSTMVYDVYDV